VESRRRLRDDVRVKVLRFAILLLAFGTAACAQPLQTTAFRALFAAQKAAPGADLVEISGQRGATQPQDWTFYFKDPAARGGVREVVVSRGSVDSVRTPLRGYAGMASMPGVTLTQLNYDSDRAFDIANRQASAARIGFHWIDYRLRANPDGSPVWVLALIDRMGVNVGELEISANDGSVNGSIRPGRRSPVSDDDDDDEDDDYSQRPPVGGLIGDVRDLGVDIGRGVSGIVLNAVGGAQEIFTGERTIGTNARRQTDEAIDFD